MSEAPEIVIEFRNVSCRAANAHELLSGLSLNVRRDEILASTYSKDVTTLPFLTHIWAQAFRSLCEAAEICVIGYSLPRAGMAVGLLLLTALHENRKYREILVIDPVGSNWEAFTEIIPQTVFLLNLA